MEILRYIISFLAAYLIGNIQTSVLLSRALYKDDVRRHGSGNAGATNMVRAFGIKSGVITFIGDMAKGILAVLLGRLIGGELGGYLAGFAVVVGHNFPVFFKFKGGKGAAATYGVAWVFSPLCAGLATPVIFLAIYLTGTVSIGSLLGMLACFIFTCIFHWGNWWMIGVMTVLTVMLVCRHTENIKRLLRGEESKLFHKKKKEQETDKQA
ncbi:MAG: glycerol-3-phosphate 1-O-acyltransferase PlsY [Clostridia bacterium]|nr:glycerol-3-phosphate 1-O-acyltransferase PlsY [Clostridia bacterium]